jgi:hypothetical protein
LDNKSSVSDRKAFFYSDHGPSGFSPSKFLRSEFWDLIKVKRPKRPADRSLVRSLDFTATRIFTCIVSYVCMFWCLSGGTQWCSSLRHCATIGKVAGSIPDGVIGIFH